MYRKLYVAARAAAAAILALPRFVRTMDTICAAACVSRAGASAAMVTTSSMRMGKPFWLGKQYVIMAALAWCCPRPTTFAGPRSDGQAAKRVSIVDIYAFRCSCCEKCPPRLIENT